MTQKDGGKGRQMGGMGGTYLALELRPAFSRAELNMLKFGPTTHVESFMTVASKQAYSLPVTSLDHGFINTIWIPGKPDILMLAAAIRWAPSSQGINKQPKQRNQTKVLVSVSTLLDALYPMDSVIIF